MHLFSPNRAICCIVLLHGWILFLTGVGAISDVIPVTGWLLLLTVEFILVNIWLWFRRDIAIWERITGFLTATSLILISIQVLACLFQSVVLALHHYTDVALGDTCVVRTKVEVR